MEELPNTGNQDGVSLEVDYPISPFSKHVSSCEAAHDRQGSSRVCPRGPCPELRRVPRVPSTAGAGAGVAGAGWRASTELWH